VLENEVSCSDQMQNSAVSKTFVATLMPYVSPEVNFSYCLLSAIKLFWLLLGQLVIYLQLFIVGSMSLWCKYSMGQKN